MTSLLPQIERELLDAAQRTKQAPVAAAGASRPPGRRKRRSPRRGVLASLAGVGAVTIVALLLLGFTGGSGTRAISIATAAYRAASPGPGILYVVTETTHTNASGQPTGSPSRLESWSTTSPDAEHSIQITGSHVFEQATTGQDQSVWTNGRPGVITTTKLPIIIGHPVDPASTLRGLYRAGRVSVARHSEIDGRPVLRLHITSPPPRAGILTPGVTVVVDAKTFAPIEMTSYGSEQTRQNGPYTIISTTVTHYLTIQHLPNTRANRDLLRIATIRTRESSPRPREIEACRAPKPGTQRAGRSSPARPVEDRLRDRRATCSRARRSRRSVDVPLLGRRASPGFEERLGL